MNRRSLTIVILFAGVIAANAERIPIVVAERATAVEKTAAEELARHLGRLYPADTFEVRAGTVKAGKRVLLGTPASNPDVRPFVRKQQLAAPESYVVTAATRAGIPLGVVAGADERGLLYGVYALLEKLGWGFYLSYEAAPEVRKQPFDFTGWDLKDAPTCGDRVVFNWHNFLSSASTWELEDFKRWIRGAARMRYNTVMVHAYGNNPMFTFRHNGQTKPIGYLATTRSGRDWGTQHVNDVRRLVGGELFRSPVFGASVALVPEDERAAAAQALMRNAFSYARDYGLHVTFALDVDTESANPQNIIRTLPESARFRTGPVELANPDTPEGYAYYKAQVDQLLAMYPQVDRLVAWFRANQGTPWRYLKREEFPEAWKGEYDAMLARNPAMASDKDASGMFAIGKIVRAFQRAIQESGRRVELGAGSWWFAHLPAADTFFPAGVKLYWLDYGIVFDQPQTQAFLRAIPRRRPMLPIVWAHHDDRTFVGRPYTPFREFASLVDNTGTGFGIIHWTTRPLDIYFKNHGEQVWSSTRNRPLKETAHEMAAKTFGPSIAETSGEYLYKWVTEGRMFGRETRDIFIDVPLKDATEVIARCRERLGLLARIDEKGLSAEQRENLRYFRDYEEFVAEFFGSHQVFERAQALHKNGETAAAREAIAQSDPRRALAAYVRASSHGGMTGGEQALVIAMNLKWAPYLLSLRQALGLETARYKFGPTQHEPLAQGAGRNTFWLDAGRAVWKQLGDNETGAPAFAERGSADDLCASGVRIERPLTLKLTGIMGDHLAGGKYQVDIVFGDSGAPVTSRKLVEVTSGAVELTLAPAPGASRLCGITVSAQGNE